MTSTLLSPQFSLALGSKQPFLSRDTPFKSHVVAVVYSLRMVFPCTQAFKLIIIDHVRKQYEPGRFSSRGLESRLTLHVLGVWLANSCGPQYTKYCSYAIMYTMNNYRLLISNTVPHCLMRALSELGRAHV